MTNYIVRKVLTIVLAVSMMLAPISAYAADVTAIRLSVDDIDESTDAVSSEGDEATAETTAKSSEDNSSEKSLKGRLSKTTEDDGEVAEDDEPLSTVESVETTVDGVNPEGTVFVDDNGNKYIILLKDPEEKTENKTPTWLIAIVVVLAILVVVLTVIVAVLLTKLNNVTGAGANTNKALIRVRKPSDDKGTQIICTLTRRKNGEVITINRDAFEIGSDEQDIDYRIAGNTAISRRHATIRQIGSEIAIEDNISTNGTFVNGERLSEGQAAVLKNGDVVTLADEEFDYRR